MTNHSSEPDANPLLGIGYEIPFDRIRPEHVEVAAKVAMDRARARLDAISQKAEKRTYDNTLGALDVACEDLEVMMGVVGHLESVSNTPELREVYNRVKPEVSAFFASIALDDALYAAIGEYAASESARALAGSRKRFLEKTLDDFRRNGAALPAPEKARLRELSRELSELTARYAQNVVDATSSFELILRDERKLAGLPPSAIEAARQSAAEKGVEGWRFSLHAPSVTPVLTYLDDAEIRKEIYLAYNTRATRGAAANPPLIARILELRREQTRLLGYATFADLVLEDRMAHDAATALRFIEDLARRTMPAFRRENDELAAFAREEERDPSRVLAPWDVAYFAEKRRKRLFDFDEEELRPFFPVDRVLDGLFETTRRLYQIDVVTNGRLPTWHRDVKTYDMRDSNGAHLGSFYVDLFPRDEKRGGAWMDSFVSGVSDEFRSTPHLGLIAANVTPPIGDNPALLTHDEVTTLFHEFGHLLHHMLSKVDVHSFVGTHVAWDFVELPSQIMENWCWERDALDLFARHWATGETIPDALHAKMSRARTYREANATLRQLGFATVDMDLHTKYEPSRDGDVVAYARMRMQEFAPATLPEDYAFICSFGHLFGSSVGYAAGYYSYKWAEVLDADAFTRFKSEGVFSREVGEAFRRKILERGDTVDPMVLYRDFMGREPRVDALLERSGLLPR